MRGKRTLFEGFHERMDMAIEKKFYLEASWYIYAILEDRLVSMLRQSGGEGKNGSADPIKMIGPKLAELKKRAKTDGLLKETLRHKAISDWAASRNTIMHAMADGSLSQEEIDKKAYLLATQGKDLIKEVSAAAMRFKKHKAKGR